MTHNQQGLLAGVILFGALFGVPGIIGYLFVRILMDL